jgi:hypothetical protein
MPPKGFITTNDCGAAVLTAHAIEMHTKNATTNRMFLTYTLLYCLLSWSHYGVREL